MRRLLFISLVMSFVMAACGPGKLFGPGLPPTPTATSIPTPTTAPTPLPTEVLDWKARTELILTTAGYVHSPDQESTCPSTCRVYANAAYGEMAAVFDDGSLIYGTASTSLTSSMDSMIASILGDQYKQWMDQQTQFPAAGKVDGHTVSLSFTELYGGRYLVFYYYAGQ